MVSASRAGGALRLRLALALLFASEAALVATFLLSEWFSRQEHAQRMADLFGRAAPRLPYPAGLPGALAPFFTGAVLLYPLALLSAWLALPAGPRGVLPRPAKLAVVALLVAAFAAYLAAAQDSPVSFFANATMALAVFVLLPLALARECQRRGALAASVLWHAVTFGVLLLLVLLEGGGAAIALYLALRFGALAWTLRIAGRPLAGAPARSRRAVAAIW